MRENNNQNPAMASSWSERSVSVPKDHILLVDDDEKLATVVKEYLAQNGFEVSTANNGSIAIEVFETGQFDLVLLDLMLPDIDGLEVCRRLRTIRNIPVLMLTAKGDPLDRIVGLEIGADDYVAKPFEPRELLARIRAILRRVRAGDVSEQNIMTFGSLEIDKDALEARLNGQRSDLTAYQFELLRILAEGAGRVLTRDQIMNCLQGDELEAFDRSIDVHISRLRAEIEDDPKQPKRVLTVRGVGYVFAKRQD